MKAAELRELTVPELEKKAADMRHELLSLRIQRANQQLKNPLKLRESRREIARILTVLNQKKGKGQEVN
jgi:large subunit ribosomal protein L29